MPNPASYVVRFKMFRGTIATWKELFSEAAAFATTVGREHLIGISHSDNGDGVVTVWYWGMPEGQ